MGNWKKRKGSKAKQRLKQAPPTQTPPNLQNRKRVVTVARAIYALVFGLVSWVSSVTVFVPKLNISPTQTFDSQSPFSVRFEFQNDGFFDVHDVHVSARVNGRLAGIVFGKGQKQDTDLATMMEMMAKQYPDRFGTNIEAGVIMDPSFIRKIESGHKPASWMSITMTKSKTREGDGLDAVVSASFRPSFAWWHKTTKRRFTTVRSQDGSFGWVEQPLE